jgi:hypothetical protein
MLELNELGMFMHAVTINSPQTWGWQYDNKFLSDSDTQQH